MEENLCQLYTREGTNNQNLQREIQKLNSQKLNDPIKKWASVLKRNFSKEYKYK
jgi:hypothetical protein